MKFGKMLRLSRLNTKLYETFTQTKKRIAFVIVTNTMFTKLIRNYTLAFVKY